MRPDNEEQLSLAIRGSNDHLCIQGGGTRGLAVAGEPLETSALTGISLYEPGALTMVAGAGTPLADVETALDGEGQMLAFEPGDLAGITGATGASTIGGVFATNASGPRRVQVGAARDFLLGVRFVDGSGNIIKNGGRVMKNVTGYDLVKLMAGSHGTLGVMTEVSFKVLPRPESAATLMIFGVEGAQAVALMAAALGSPWDVSGAAHEPQQRAGSPVTFIRIEGFEDSVAYRLQRLRDHLAPMIPTGADVQLTEISDTAKARKQWVSLRNLEDDNGTPWDVWRLSIKASNAPELMKSAPCEGGYVLDWGGGRVWAFCEPGTDLRAALGAIDGHATLVHTPTGTKLPRFHPEPAPIARLTAGLRAQFDPKGILNAGLTG